MLLCSDCDAVDISCAWPIAAHCRHDISEALFAFIRVTDVWKYIITILRLFLKHVNIIVTAFLSGGIYYL